LLFGSKRSSGRVWLRNWIGKENGMDPNSDFAIGNFAGKRQLVFVASGQKDLRGASSRDTFRSRPWTLSSVVEHYLHTVGVAGSKPAASTIFLPPAPASAAIFALQTPIL
jgi:hypothetical protein